MLFNTSQFILLFLPVTFAVYFWLNRKKQILAAKAWLVTASLYFYAYWDIRFLPIILLSMAFNYAIGTGLAQGYQRKKNTLGMLHKSTNKKTILAFGIACNLVLLAYFKYRGFFIENLNHAFDTSFSEPKIILPLAISFFTFQQIAYLVDSFRGETAEYDLLNYSLFVTFFPQLIAGPIVHHREMMSQFRSRWTLLPRYRNILLGLFIFAIGLFKKAGLADTFAQWANAGFDGTQQLSFYAAWATSLSYTFQLYFDFSGYCDMATGAALLFNIHLPINFNSPYKAIDIKDFWRRWHITLSRFLRDYLYIPLGGNRLSISRTYVNLMLTFILGGLWHGASWMFVIWGALHGGALVINNLYRLTNLEMPKALAWTITFLFVNVSWVFFRANTMVDAMNVLNGMVDIKSAFSTNAAIVPTAELAWGGWFSDVLLQSVPATMIGYIIPFFAIILAFALITLKNAYELAEGEWNKTKLWSGAVLLSIGIYLTVCSASKVFLYFNF